MKRPRFRLRSIFLLMTLICVLVGGIKEWHRRLIDKLHSEIGMLEAERFVLLMNEKATGPRPKELMEVEARINEKLQPIGLTLYPERRIKHRLRQSSPQSAH